MFSLNAIPNGPSPENLSLQPTVFQFLIYGSFGVSIVGFATFFSRHRWHENELSRHLHFKIGVTRIQLARDGFQSGDCTTIVVAELVKDAFVSPLIRDKKLKARYRVIQRRTLPLSCWTRCLT
jgi:hypothetical protein